MTKMLRLLFFGTLLMYQQLQAAPVVRTDTDSSSYSRVADPFIVNLFVKGACAGQTNGSAKVLGQIGGQVPYTYQWSNGNTTPEATGLAAGTYTITVTDGLGDIVIKTITIIEAEFPLTATPDQTNVTCNGAADGSALIYALGGTGPYTYSWTSSGSSMDAAFGLAAGNYTCTITDANSCTFQQSYNITEPAALAASITGNDITCNGLSDGKAYVTVTGGTPPYTYAWSNMSGAVGTQDTARNLIKGLYFCVITDVIGCTITKTVTITAPTAITSTTAKTNVYCKGAATGSASVTPNGGTLPYTYAWSPSGGTADIASGLTADNYTCTITDKNGCTLQKNISITETAIPITATARQINVSCNGGSNAVAYVENVAGGAGGYTYSWYPTGGSAATASGLLAGYYTCTITDADHCTLSKVFNISEPALMSANTTREPASCYGLSDGEASVTDVTGGAGNYTYSWALTNGTGGIVSTSPTASNIKGAQYTCTITDDNMCTLKKSVQVLQPSPLSATITQTDVRCFNAATGDATVTPSGGTPFNTEPYYTYSWAPSGGNTNVASDLKAGTYTCTITDGNGCTLAKPVTIAQSPAITADTAYTNVRCNGGADGIAAVKNVQGGAGSFTYSWSPSGGTAPIATGLIAGEYTCTIKDANNCTIEKVFNILEPAAIAIGYTPTNVSCNGGSNGSIVLTATGGTPPYTYSWSPTGGSAAIAMGLTPGTYTCTIMDKNTCFIIQSIDITQPDPLTATATQKDISCNGKADGSATVTPSGGAGDYTYSWSPSGGTGATATGLSAGTYTCTIMDRNTCSITQSVTIVDNTQPINATPSHTNITCNGTATGSATVTASGGAGSFNYAWSPSGGTAATAANLTVGDYTCTFVDANGCQNTESFSLTEPAKITYTVTQTNPSSPLGADGLITVAASGGTGNLTYHWSHGVNVNTASLLRSGTYTCTITDAKGCTAEATVTLIAPPAMSNFATQNKQYGDAPFTLANPSSNSTGAFSYTSSNTAVATITGNTVTIIKPGTTTITATQTATNDHLTGSITANLTINRRNISVAIANTPEITKVYDGNNTAFIPAENYLITGKLAGDDIRIMGTATYSSKNAGSTNPVTASNLTITGAQNDLYNITNSNATITGSITQKMLTPDVYAITKVYDGTTAATVTFKSLTTAYGLVGTDEVSVIAENAVYNNKNAGTSNPVSIAGLTLTGKDAANYFVNNMAAVGKITPKSMTVTADNKEIVKGAAIPTFTASYDGFVNGEKVAVLSTLPTLTTTATAASLPGTYPIKATGAVATNYSFTYKEGSLLIKAAPIVIVNGQPTMEVLTDRSICSTNAVQEIGVTGISAGSEQQQTYTLDVTASKDFFSLLEIVNVTNTTATIRYTLKADAAGEVILKAGVTDNGGVENGGIDRLERSFKLTITSIPTITLTADKTQPIAKGESVVLTATGTALNYIWSDAIGELQNGRNATVTVTPQQTTTYTVRGSIDNCYAEKSHKVEITEAPAIIPSNVITPNNDGYNDKWVIKNIASYPENEVKIFDQSGRLVYTKIGYRNEWDGTLNGQSLKEGAYLYSIDLKNGSSVIKGYLTIVRK
jgi:gliding motility-associated-like protein